MTNHTPDVPHKQCSKCKKLLPATAEYFHRNSGHKDGLLNVCITCRGFTKREELVAKDGFKICRVCREEKPATEEYFGIDGHLAYRPFRYLCRVCECRKAMDRYNREKEKRGIQSPPIKLKQCQVCKQLLERTEENFRRRYPSSPTLHHTCRKCDPPKPALPGKAKSREERPVDQVIRDRAEQAANMENERQAAIDRGILNPKRCSKCKEWKPATTEYYYRNSGHTDGLETSCKVCRTEYQRRNKERAYAAHKRWRDNNRDQYRKLHREAKRRKPNDPEKRRAWEEKNRERMRISVVNRAAKRASLPHDFTQADWQFALSYFGGCCAVCGRPPGLFHTLAMDHFYALSKPECIGTLPTNILPLCHGQGGCNNEKHNRDPEEWLTEKLGKRKAKEMLAKIHEFFSKVRQV